MVNDMKPGSVAGYIKSGYALVQRNYNLIKHEMGWEVVNAIYQVVNALTIGFIGVSGPQEGLNERVLFLVASAASCLVHLTCAYGHLWITIVCRLAINNPLSSGRRIAAPDTDR
jgi:hypothetical protein